MNPAPVRLTVELAAAADESDEGEAHVEGTVIRPDGAEHAFVGWVGLMAVLHDSLVST